MAWVQTPTYRAWCHMKGRCLNKTDAAYSSYGGRGIRVCERWMEYKNFLADMGVRPEGLSLDRVDNDRDYELANCRWITHKEQQRNKRNSRWIEFNGQRKTLGEWAEIYGIVRQVISTRLRCGWSLEDSFTKPVIPSTQKKRRSPEVSP